MATLKECCLKNTFQVAIPISGLKEIKECIADFISKFGEGFMDSQNELMDSLTLKTELGKTFYFDANQNERGSFLRVSEVSLFKKNQFPMSVNDSYISQFLHFVGQVFERIPHFDHDSRGIACRVP